MKLKYCISIMGAFALFGTVNGAEFEAENYLMGSSKKIVDNGARGGFYSGSTRSWEPLFSAPIPEGDNDLHVWVRWRGIDLCVKTAAEGKQKELNWVWGRQENWTWKKTGTYSRSDLGTHLVIIRNQGDVKNSGLDCVVITEDAAWQPDSDEEAGEATADRAVIQDKRVEVQQLSTTPLKLEINWMKESGTTSRKMFSTAVFSGFDPDIVENPKYIENMKYMNIGLARYHNRGMMQDSGKEKGWLDVKNKTWDREKIIRAVKAWPLKNAERVICVCEWPEWMDKDHDRFLDKDEYENFAQLCAELVRIINIEAKQGINYFEITNELDGLYWIKQDEKGESTRLQELADIFNLTAKKVKAVDPSILTGGPSAMRPDYHKRLREFVRATKDNLDFFTFHAYCSGSKQDSDAKIYNKSKMISNYVNKLQRMLREEIPNRHVEAHLNEYNISWTWTIRDPRMINHKSAVFDTLMFIELARSRIDGANSWNEMDGVYGKIDNNHNLRPAAHAYNLFNSFFIGKIVESTIAEDGRVVVLAVKDGKNRAIAIVNRCDIEQNIQLELPISCAKLYSINDAGFSDKTVNDLRRVKTTPHSVTVIQTKSVQ